MEIKPIYKSIDTLPPSAWHNLAKKSIFWGHQSVGGNICTGLASLLRDNRHIPLQIVETNHAADITPATFSHCKIGNNHDPLSKNEAFTAVLSQGIGERVSIAFFKYCYVDITEKSDPYAIFSSYFECINELQNKFPAVLFIHVTVPLTVVQTGPKAWIKKILNRKIGGYADNISRNVYNGLMRQTYGGNAPIFDLAWIESCSTGGTISSFKEKNAAYQSLATEYTDDGRHLNDRGSKIVAEQLLILLAELSITQQGGT